MIAGFNKRIIRVNHKHGFKLPTSVTDAKRLDKMNEHTLWIDAFNMEIENLKVAFDVLDYGHKIPVGHDKASSHLTFDVSMTLEWKARWIKDSHKTTEPEWSTFAGVVSR